MNKKITIIISLLLLITAGGYFFIKFNFLKAKDFKTDTSKEKSIIDLRPSAIAKLQQLVKDGSDGLYILSIEKISPDVVESKVEIVNAQIHIDTAAMLRLDSLKKLPDDIFTIEFDSLHIDGIGIDDILNKNQVDIASLNITNPVIKVYHKTRMYNKAKREHNDTLSLYDRIKGQLDEISIGNINVDKGTFINYTNANRKGATKFTDINMRVGDLLIDSSTQFDTDRFLFAKHVTIDAKNYMIPTPDSLYNFRAGAISISAEQHKMNLLNVELKPRGNRAEFESKLRFRKDMYHITLPKVTLYGVDWWAMMNYEKFIANKGEITGGDFAIFVDRSLPPSPPIKVNNFPHQLLMKIPIPVSVTTFDLKHVNVSYEEYNPDAQQGSIAYFDNVNGQLNYVSNISGDIKKHPVAKFSGSGLFMHHVPMRARFTFDLSKYKTGNFTAEVDMDTLDNLTINPIAEPLGLFSVKSGKITHANAHLQGNDFTTKCKVAISYTDLHIKPLKKADENSRLKKKHLAGFFANVFLIKNENPVKGKELRQPEYSVERDHHRNFFNMVWVAILTGISKTIGVPSKFVIHKP